MYRTRFFPAKLIVKRLYDGDAINLMQLSRADVFVSEGDSSSRISLPYPGKSYDSRGLVIINDGSLSLPIDCEPDGFLGDNGTTSIGAGNVMTYVCYRIGADKWRWCEGG